MAFEKSVLSLYPAAPYERKATAIEILSCSKCDINHHRKKESITVTRKYFPKSSCIMRMLFVCC